MKTLEQNENGCLTFISSPGAMVSTTLSPDGSGEFGETWGDKIRVKPIEASQETSELFCVWQKAMQERGKIIYINGKRKKVLFGFAEGSHVYV